MSEQSEHNDSTPVVSRLMFALYVTLGIGVISVSVAHAFGDTAVKQLLLATLSLAFLIGGGLLGLLVSHHVAQIHLPEGSMESQGPTPLTAEELRVEQEMRKTKGFLGLFTVSRENYFEGRPVEDSQVKH